MHVTPHEAAQAVRSLCNYIAAGNPDKARVRSELRRIREAVLAPRQAVQVGKFTRSEYDAASNGIQALVDKVMKAAKTMNPQDPGRTDLEKEASQLLQVKSLLGESFKNLSKLSV